MLNRFVIIMVMLMLIGCGKNFHSDFGWAKPASLQMKLDVGSEKYRQGYADGCESGYSGYSSSFNKMFYTWKQDPQLTPDPVYYQIWKDAYSYCAFYGMIMEEHGLGNWR